MVIVATFEEARAYGFLECLAIFARHQVVEDGIDGRADEVEYACKQSEKYIKVWPLLNMC